jgi:DnaA family protein
VTRQLTLEVNLPKDPALNGFVAGPNAEALAAVQGCADGSGESYLYLWGPSGSGKTHLLLGASRDLEGRGQTALYLDLGTEGLEPAMLQGLESLELVCLDNIQLVAGDRDWERALFDLFNRLRENGCRLLAAAHVPVAELGLRLPDLRSRLNWGPAFRLRPLGDESRMQLLQRAAYARGMRLETKAAEYILQHCPRDLHSLERVLDRIEAATLAEKRAPNLAFLRRVLKTLEPG